MRPDLSIIIPCFNEARNISIILNQLEQIIKQTKYDIEIVVIDGCSSDSTPIELKEKFETLPRNNFKLILNEKRGGYGADINKALAFASGDVLSWTHADMQTDIKDVITAFELFKKIDNDKVIIKGKRKNRRMSETFFSFGMQIAVFLLLRVNLSDINAQPKLFSKDFYNNFLKNKSPSDFSLDLFMLYQAKKNNYKIIETPVYFKKRLYGEAKGGGSFKTKIKLIFRTFAYIVKLKLIIKN